MIFDCLREYEKIYMRAGEPEIMESPRMKYLAVRRKDGQKGIEEECGKALNALYEIARTIRKSYSSPHKVVGSREYLMPLLEGFCPLCGNDGVDWARTADSSWVYAICLPEFATPGDFQWAVREASRKAGVSFSNVELFIYDGGLCVQCVHIGSDDGKAETIRSMERFARENGYTVDDAPGRFHHEIYLRDPRRTEPVHMKTVIRYPVKKVCRGVDDR
jgi:hypothetical protein